MKLWILRPAENLKNGDNPWDPWYDKAYGFVVRAENENAARKFAHEEAGDENRGNFLRKNISNTDSPWLDPKYSTCTLLDNSGQEGVVMRDFCSA